MKVRIVELANIMGFQVSSSEVMKTCFLLCQVLFSYGRGRSEGDVRVTSGREGDVGV